MDTTTVRDTGYFSLVRGKMPKGCEYCVRGEKLVLFVTGLCGLKCFYCPVSDKKIYKDVVYANEWKITKVEELLEEACLTEAKGAGITGGDPLIKVDRVCEYISLFKQKFGKDFHVHLYTPLKFVTVERLEKLHNAGLDEIRFHPDLDDKTLWSRIELARKYDWDIGIEIPCIPAKKGEILKLIDYVKDKVDFFNMNELELSERNMSEFRCRGFRTKDNISYAIKGSAELGKEILEEAKDMPSLYFCTAKLKDAVQMRNRIIRRARNVKKKFDIVTSEGTIIRGAIYLSDLVPGFKYREKLELADKTTYLQRLTALRNEIIAQFGVLEEMVFIDEVKLRLIINQKALVKISSKLKKQGYIPAIVEEYPTHDALEMDVNFL